MGWEFFLRRFSSELPQFFKDSGQRWATASDKISKGTYTSADIKTDIKNSVTDVIDLWAASLSLGPADVVPVARQDITAANIAAQGIDMVAALESPITAGAPAVVDGKLYKLGDTTTFINNVAVGVIGSLNDEIQVTAPVQVAGAGQYQGTITHNNKVVAVALLTVT